MSEGQAIRIPQEFVNDDAVKFLRWMVVEGQEVREGESVAEIETSKAVVELAAVACGKIRQQAKAGDEVRVGEVVGFISANGWEENSAALTATANGVGGGLSGGNGSSAMPPDVRFSKKALELAAANGVDVAVFAGRGLVRTEDVVAYLKERSAISAGKAPHVALEGISLDRVTLPALTWERERGVVEREFLETLRKNAGEIARLSSGKKCELYRKHGAAIGVDVRLGSNTVIVAPQIHLGDRAQIGENGSIQCRERFAMAQLSSFRGDLTVRGGTVVIGENIFAGSRIQIGGGGNADPDSFLAVGDGTYLGDDIFVNICRPVLLGREVFLTQRSILVTHNIGHSILEGYENRFAPIVLEDYAQVGMNSTIYAGTRVGAGSIVMSNSYVISGVPPGKLAAGVPAKVIRDAVRPLDRKRQIEIVHTMIREYRELLVRKGHEVRDFGSGSAPGFVVKTGGRRFTLLFQEACANLDMNGEESDESVAWTLETGQENEMGSVVMDLLAKRILGAGGIFVESTREFLRKRGIRLEPGPWRYSGGLI